ALQAALAAGDVAEVVADVEDLEEESDVGVSYRVLIAEVTSEAGAELREPAPMIDGFDAPGLYAEPGGPPIEPDGEAADGEPVGSDPAGGQEADGEPVVPVPKPSTAAEDADDGSA